MKKLSILIACAMVCLHTFAQSLSIGYANVVPMEKMSVHPSVGTELSVGLNKYISASLMYDVSVGTAKYHTFIDNSNLSYVMAFDVVKLFAPRMDYAVDVKAGYGWGHQFGNLQTDHNYHTYTLGATYRYMMSSHFDFCISPYYQWRTWQGHMGLNKKFSWVRCELSLRYNFLFKKNKSSILAL